MRTGITAELIATYIINVINITQCPESELYIDINKQYADYTELNYYTVNDATWITITLESKLLTFCVVCWNKLAGTVNGTQFVDIALNTDNRIEELTSYIERMM